MSKKIDLRQNRTEIEKFVKNSLKEFAEENPDEIVIAFGLFSQPWNGWIWFCINSIHEDDDLEEVDRDTDCAEWEHFEFREIDLPSWQELYFEESLDNIEIVESNGNTFEFSHKSGGDALFSEPFYRSFVDILKGMEKTFQVEGVRFAPEVEVLVEIGHMNLFDSWTVKNLSVPVGN